MFLVFFLVVVMDVEAPSDTLIVNQRSDICNLPKPMVFNLPKEPFSVVKAICFIQNNDLNGLLKYFINYFFVIYGTDYIYFYDATLHEFELLTKNKLVNYLPPNISVDLSGKKIKLYDVLKSVRRYNLVDDNTNHKVWYNQRWYFNVAPIVKSANTKPYNSFDDKAKKAVQCFWFHIKKFWSKENEEVFDFTQQWIIYATLGFKTNCAIVNYSKAKGIGKTIVFDILQKQVFGNSVALKDDHSECLKSTANASKLLFGKSLILLDEFHKFSQVVWNAREASLKNLITSDVYMVANSSHPLNGKKNCLNFMINTNEYEAIPMSNTSRRYLFNKVELPDEMKQSDLHQYFSALDAQCKVEEFGECFFAFCCAYYKEHFDFRKIPETDFGSCVKSDNIGPVEQFLKENYVLKHLPLNTLISTLFDQFKIKNKKFQFNNFYLTISYYFKNYISDGKIFIDYTTLLKLFIENNLISDYEIDCYDLYSKRKPNQENTEELFSDLNSFNGSEVN